MQAGVPAQLVEARSIPYAKSGKRRYSTRISEERCDWAPARQPARIVRLKEVRIMGRLEGKVAFITGSGSGIARAAARLFALEGASITIAELKPELGRTCEAAVRDSGGDAAFVETDVTQEESVRSAI